MTPPSGSDTDMPNFPWSSSASAEDAALAALLSGPDVPDLTAGLQPAADVIAALRARPSVDELAGESAARAEFREIVGVSPRRSSPLRRPRLIPSLISAKAAVAAAAVVVAIGGVATAAYAGALPGPAQRFAHDVIDAPAAHHADAHGHKPGKFGITLGRRHHHHHRFFCAGASPSPSSTATPATSPTPAASPSWSPKPSWSASPRPTPTGTPSPRPYPTCTPAPHPSHSPRPHPTGSPFPGRFRHHHHHGFRHHHHRGFPGPRPTPHPTGSPSATPSPSASA